VVAAVANCGSRSRSAIDPENPSSRRYQAIELPTIAPPMMTMS
jgi:hypothetical protein